MRMSPEYMRAWREAHKDKVEEYAKRRRAKDKARALANPTWVAEQRYKRKLRRYQLEEEKANGNTNGRL